MPYLSCSTVPIMGMTVPELGTGVEMSEEVEVERTFPLSDGDCVVLDPDYLDPACEAEGVLAIQWSVERGLWVLYGSTDAKGYSQEWIAPGAVPAAGAKLRPVN